MIKVSQLQGELAAFQGQQSVQQPQVREPSFSAAKIKLDLFEKFSGKLAEMSGWIFSIDQYCRMVGVIKPVDMVKLAVSRLEHVAFTQWCQLACRGIDYQNGMLGWSDFKADLADALVDIDRVINLHLKLALLKQQTSIASYTKQFRQIILELGDQAPDNMALLFMFTEGLKADTQMQVLLAWPQVLAETEQIAKRADMPLFSSGKHQAQQGYQKYPRQQQPHNPQFQQYCYQRPLPPPPAQGPIPMDLGALQGQEQCQQTLPQYGAARQIICYLCGKQGHMVKDCCVRLRGQPIQKPSFALVQQPMGQKQLSTMFAHTYMQPPQFQPAQYQTIYNYILMGALQQPQFSSQQQQSLPEQAQQPPPPPPLNDFRGIY